MGRIVYLCLVRKVISDSLKPKARFLLQWNWIQLRIGLSFGSMSVIGSNFFWIFKFEIVCDPGHRQYPWMPLLPIFSDVAWRLNEKKGKFLPRGVSQQNDISAWPSPGCWTASTAVDSTMKKSTYVETKLKCGFIQAKNWVCMREVEHQTNTNCRSVWKQNKKTLDDRQIV